MADTTDTRTEVAEGYTATMASLAQASADLHEFTDWLTINGPALAEPARLGGHSPVIALVCHCRTLDDLMRVAEVMGADGSTVTEKRTTYEGKDHGDIEVLRRSGAVFFRAWTPATHDQLRDIPRIAPEPVEAGEATR